MKRLEKREMNLLNRFRSEPNYNEIMVWAERFRWANLIKSSAGGSILVV
jgi:hypothetical protein